MLQFVHLASCCRTHANTAQARTPPVARARRAEYNTSRFSKGCHPVIVEERAVTQTNLIDLIRNIPDFPIPGIQFKDITTLLANTASPHGEHR